jgi:hypothetical protein
MRIFWFLLFVVCVHCSDTEDEDEWEKHPKFSPQIFRISKGSRRLPYLHAFLIRPAEQETAGYRILQNGVPVNQTQVLDKLPEGVEITNCSNEGNALYALHSAHVLEGNRTRVPAFFNFFSYHYARNSWVTTEGPLSGFVNMTKENPYVSNDMWCTFPIRNDQRQGADAGNSNFSGWVDKKFFLSTNPDRVRVPIYKDHRRQITGIAEETAGKLRKLLSQDNASHADFKNRLTNFLCDELNSTVDPLLMNMVRDENPQNTLRLGPRTRALRGLPNAVFLPAYIANDSELGFDDVAQTLGSAFAEANDTGVDGLSKHNDLLQKQIYWNWTANAEFENTSAPLVRSHSVRFGSATAAAQQLNGTKELRNHSTVRKRTKQIDSDDDGEDTFNTKKATPEDQAVRGGALPQAPVRILGVQDTRGGMQDGAPARPSEGQAARSHVPTGSNFGSVRPQAAARRCRQAENSLADSQAFGN